VSEQRDERDEFVTLVQTRMQEAIEKTQAHRQGQQRQEGEARYRLAQIELAAERLLGGRHQERGNPR
jgi:hypothetical protein